MLEQPRDPDEAEDEPPPTIDTSDAPSSADYREAAESKPPTPGKDDEQDDTGDADSPRTGG